MAELDNRVVIVASAASGIGCVNAVGPALIRTPMIAALEQGADMYQSLLGRHPIGRLPVDGGYLVQ